MDSTLLYVFVPCHNRQAVTTAFISHLFSELSEVWDIRVHILDDGSTDGTGEAIQRRWPECIIHRLNGKAYWGGCLRYIQKYVAHSLPTNRDLLVLITNDDIYFQANALVNAVNLIRSRKSTAIIPVVVDIPCSNWNTSELARQDLDTLALHEDFSINYGDHYDPSRNHYVRLSRPGVTNIGVTSALLIRRESLVKSSLIPMGLPHYGSDFWLTHSLSVAGEELLTDQKYVVLRRQETTRPSSRHRGRIAYWKQCCNPSSPDYLPASIIFQRQFSRHPYKVMNIVLLTLKYCFMKLISGKSVSADLDITVRSLLLGKPS